MVASAIRTRSRVGARAVAFLLAAAIAVAVVVLMAQAISVSSPTPDATVWPAGRFGHMDACPNRGLCPGERIDRAGPPSLRELLAKKS
jgi:hypothetical protein